MSDSGNLKYQLNTRKLSLQMSLPFGLIVPLRWSTARHRPASPELSLRFRRILLDVAIEMVARHGL
jgi:hypothetical protein